MFRGGGGGGGGGKRVGMGRDLDENDITAFSPGIFDQVTKLQLL